MWGQRLGGLPLTYCLKHTELRRSEAPIRRHLLVLPSVARTEVEWSIRRAELPDTSETRCWLVRCTRRVLYVLFGVDEGESYRQNRSVFGPAKSSTATTTANYRRYAARSIEYSQDLT
jgi:hypothetical protein